MREGAMDRQPALDASLEQVLYQVKRVIVGQDALLERCVECWLAIHCSLSHFWRTLPAPPAVPIGTAKPMPMK